MTHPAEAPHRWGPSVGAFVFGGILLAASSLWLVAGRTPMDTVIAILVIAIVAGMMLAGLRMRDRLIASAEGVTIGTLKGPRRVPWFDVGRIEVVRRKRWGSMGSALEIDLPGDELAVFTRMDLGTDPEKVLPTLQSLRDARAG